MWGVKGITPTLAAQQGKLGDNWFLAESAAVAEQPDFVRDIFVIQKFNDAGIFAFKFYLKGQVFIQTIDDRVPVLDNNTPINARQSPQGAWWLVLLEKAYAKLNGNYANLDGGNVLEALRTITG